MTRHNSKKGLLHFTRWCRAVILLKEKHGYAWHLQKWGPKFSQFTDQVCKEESKEIIQDASKFALDGDINLDILRKCFLIQVLPIIIYLEHSLLLLDLVYI